MLNSSTTAVGLSGPPHFVDLHVNPGESVSIQLFDGNETVLRGPATVTMISQHSFPPVPMPVQVPPGHMVQQIVDENGTLRHIILSALNNNGTTTSNTTPTAATLVPQQQAYPYCCCCCYCSTSNFFSRDLLSSSMPSPNPLPTPPPPPPPPPPIHHSNLWEMGLTHVDSTRRLPFSRTNSKVNSYNIDMTFPPSPTTTIRRRLPNRNYSYSKRSPSTLLQATTTSTTTTTTTSTASINNNTSITTTTITTTATGTSPTSNSHSNGVSTKLSSSGVLSIATVTSTLTTTTTTAATSTVTTSSSSTTNSPSSTSVRGINGKTQTLTVTVSETGSVSRTGAITFPVTHLRTNGGNVATKLTTSVPELITSTDQSTKHQQQQATKIECLLFSNSNNSVTSGSFNNYNNKHNSVVTNLSSSTSSHHHHHHHHHHIFTHGNEKLVDNEKNKSSHHHKDNSSSGVLVNRTATTTNGLLVGSPSSPIKNGSLSTNTKSSTLSTKTQSSNHSPKNDHLSRKVRREDKTKEEKDIKSKENTPQRKKSNIINSSIGGTYTLDNEIGRNSSGASSASNSKESSPIKIPLNRLSHCKPLQSPIPAIIPINVTLATGTSTTTVPIISIPVEAASLSKKGCDLGSKESSKEPINDPETTSAPISASQSLLRSDISVPLTLEVVSSTDSKIRNETKESNALIETDSKYAITKSTGRNLLNRGQQQSHVSTSLGTLPTSVIVNEFGTMNDENSLVVIESETKQNISEIRPNEKSSTKSNVTKLNDNSDVQEIGDKLKEAKVEDDEVRNISKKGQDAKKKKDAINHCDDGQIQQSELQSDEKTTAINADSDVKRVDKDDIEQEPSKVKEDIDVVSSTNESNRSDIIASEQKCKSDDKIDSQQRSPPSEVTCNGYVNSSVTNAEVINEDSNGDNSYTHARDNHKNDDDKTMNLAIDDDDNDDDDNEEEEEDDEEDSMSKNESNSATNGINNNITTTIHGDPGDKPKNSPQRSPKHLLPQIQVFYLTYTSLTATSVKLKWINEQGHHNNYHHSHHHAPSSSYGSLISETRHYMVEMMKSNKSNAKNGTVTPTTRIVYQGTQASCRVSHLTPSEQYSFRVRSSENNHQLVSNVLTLVTPEHQPVTKHHKRSRAQNSNQQVQLSSESLQKQQHFNQNQEQAAFRQQESLNNKIDGETRIIRSEQKCAIVIISLVSVLAVILACIIHNLLMY